VQHLCAFAEATLTPDTHTDRLVPLLRSSDPVLAAVAAWRLGRVAEPTDAIVDALLRRYVGPPGLPRDAAAAALARLLSGAGQPQRVVAPPPPRGNNWSTALQRWLAKTVAPSYRSLPASALGPHHDALRSALRAGARGTRAERAAVERVMGGTCEQGKRRTTADARRDGTMTLCLAPLVEETVTLPAERN
jgi:hypothetical protein